MGVAGKQKQLLFSHEGLPLSCFLRRVLQDLHLEFFQLQMTRDECQTVQQFAFSVNVLCPSFSK